ncbi:MAG: RNA polymerase subunit sigma [Planctomycetes bacterium]|nr:RNA polymerase subunit sigma [Planctomycetota bacterium]
MSDVTGILCAIERGEPAAAEQLLPLVYEELRKLAAARMAGEASGQTLQATALVHEAYVRLVENERPGPAAPRWDSRGHFFAAAAEAMRRILIERARHKQTRKHGGALRRVDLDSNLAVDDEPADELLALNEALTEFERHDPQAPPPLHHPAFGPSGHPPAPPGPELANQHQLN